MTIDAWNEGVRLSWRQIFIVLTFLVYSLFYERQQERARKALKDMNSHYEIEPASSESKVECSMADLHEDNPL